MGGWLASPQKLLPNTFSPTASNTSISTNVVGYFVRIICRGQDLNILGKSFVRCQKMKRWESSETRFGKVSCLSDQSHDPGVNSCSKFAGYGTGPSPYPTTETFFGARVLRKAFSNDRAHCCNSICQIFVQIGATLAIVRPFEVFRAVWINCSVSKCHPSTFYCRPV